MRHVGYILIDPSEIDITVDGVTPLKGETECPVFYDDDRPERVIVEIPIAYEEQFSTLHVALNMTKNEVFSSEKFTHI